MTGPRHLGNYTLGTRLGSGGTSEVYAGQHRFLGDAVAIKLVRVGAEDDAIDAFVAEAARTRAVEHPNVVRVLDVGRDDPSGAAYLVMERVDGENLATRLARVGRLDEAEARRLGAAIADGIAAAHDRGIVHRDLKPANVMLSGDEPKIVDFGIAKALGDRAAVETSRRIGTPAYMAPEQLTAGLISPAVDVWALGVILFEVVAGEMPFKGYEDGRCPQLFEVAPRLASRRADVSPAFDALVARCLGREPGQRPASMREIARALRAGPVVTDVERVTADLGPDDAPRVTAATLPARRSSPRVARALIGLAGLAGIAVLAVAVLRSPGASGRNPSAAPAGDAAPAVVVEPDVDEQDIELGEAEPTGTASDPQPGKRKSGGGGRPRTTPDARPAAGKPDAEGLD